jgi:hypothetical protein
VARAKRTERAEARRRHRAAVAAATAEGDHDAEETAAGSSDQPSPGSSRSTSTARSNTPAPTGRVGFAEAFRLSFRPINVRDDLASLPWIAIHSKALWVPIAITIIATAYVVVSQGKDILAQLGFQYFIQTPAIGGVFIAGFLAPRAGWLLGVIVGLVSAACYSLLVISFGTVLYPAAPPTQAEAMNVAVSAFLLSPLIGSFFAAAAAWYRRFLAYSSPNRGRQSQAAKPRAGDGRTRTRGTSQKAGAKR